MQLSPRMTLSMAMALQELATNAAKYGALSNGTGTLSITWKVHGPPHGERLHFRWQESGGPPVSPPTRQGFGSRLIERTLASDLAGEVSVEFAPAGVVCTVDAPLQRPARGAPAHA